MRQPAVELTVGEGVRAVFVGILCALCGVLGVAGVFMKIPALITIGGLANLAETGLSCLIKKDNSKLLPTFLFGAAGMLLGYYRFDMSCWSGAMAGLCFESLVTYLFGFLMILLGVLFSKRNGSSADVCTEATRTEGEHT